MTRLIDGGLTATIADDAAFAFTAPLGRTQGCVVVMTRSASAGFARALYWYRVATSGSLLVMGEPSGSTSNEATGALTGTTGTDGVMTVSAHTDGKIYVENRSGSSKVVDVIFLGGSI